MHKIIPIYKLMQIKYVIYFKIIQKLKYYFKITFIKMAFVQNQMFT